MAFRGDRTKRKPIIVLSVMVLVCLVLLVADFAFFHLINVVFGKPFESRTKPTPSDLRAPRVVSIDGTGGASTRNTPSAAPEENPAKQT